MSRPTQLSSRKMVSPPGTAVTPAITPQLTPQQREMQEKHGAIVPALQLTFASCKKLKSFIKDYSYNCGKSIKINNNSQAVTYFCSDENCPWKITAVKPRSDRNETDPSKKGQFKITKVHNVHSYHCSSVSKTPLRQQRLMKQQAQAALRASLGQAPLTPQKGRGRPRKNTSDCALVLPLHKEDVTAVPGAEGTEALPLEETLPVTADPVVIVCAKAEETVIQDDDAVAATTAVETTATSLDTCHLHVDEDDGKELVEDDEVVDDDDDGVDITEEVDDHTTPVLLSNGPFTVLPHPISLAMERDKEWLPPLHCFVRKHFSEVFTATQEDVTAPSKGKHKPISVGQIGIRCPHCHAKFENGEDGSNTKTAAPKSSLPQFAQPYHVSGSLASSVYYPASIKCIYNDTMNFIQRHLYNCREVPQDIMRQYETLRLDDARSGTSKRYWEASAACLGLVDTLDGVRFSSLPPPPLPSMESMRGHGKMFNDGTGDSIGVNDDDLLDAYECMGSALEQQQIPIMHSSLKPCTDNYYKGPIVVPEDKPFATLYSYYLMDQMTPIIFTETDRLGKRKSLPTGFAGLACTHCIGEYGTGRFFPSTVKALADTSKTLNVLHNHLMRCRLCPIQVREALDKLRCIHDEERSKMDFGSQKKFFQRIWDRLHCGIVHNFTNTDIYVATTSPKVGTTPATTIVADMPEATTQVVTATAPIVALDDGSSLSSLKRPAVTHPQQSEDASHPSSPQISNKHRKIAQI